MTEPDEGKWRIRAGVGLVIHAPLSAERRAIVEAESQREAEQERRAAELAAELRADAEIERAAEWQRLGHRPRTQQEFLADVSFAQDRADAAESRREREAAELAAQPPPHRPTIWEQKLERQQAHAHAIVEPASKGDVRKLSQSIASLASKVGILGRRRSAEQDYSQPQNYRAEQGYHEPRNYTRNSGQIVRGPY